MKTNIIAIAVGILLLSRIVAAPQESQPSQPSTPNSAPKFIFQSYSGDPKKADPKNMDFGINVVGLRQPTQFLKLGETIRNTTLKLHKFQFKTRIHPQRGEEDASELTLISTVTQETLVLPISPVVHSLPKRTQPPL